MAAFDLIVRNGRVVTRFGDIEADLGIVDGVFVEIAPGLAGTASVELDATGAIVLPGVIDPHVHFNEPGRGDWEGWATGSTALAMGGGTSCIEMPLNAHPPTLDRASFEEKVRLASVSSRVDFALWGGLTPTNLTHLHDLASCGVVGFKAFMSNSAMDDFLHADDFTLFEGMEIAASLGLPVAVHAENDAITSGLAARAISLGRMSARDYLESRPILAELEAIGRAITIAEETGCALHVVHVSSGRGVSLIAAAQERGVDVTCETCPHYLVFTDQDVEEIGALAKCAPPLRDQVTQDDLWATLLAGNIDMISSDHSPAPPSMKHSPNFFANWGGINGCQHLLVALATSGADRGMTLGDVAALTSKSVARRFALGGKGEIAVGQDADFTWVSPQIPASIPVDDVCYRYPHSIWDEFPMAIRVIGTALRGQIIVKNGQIASTPTGQLLRPARADVRNWPFDDRD
jgi:allantoinase